MKSTTSHKNLLTAILSGAYTPLDVREFVQLCYTLALPLIRKKIVSGKLNLDMMRLKEVDIVYDCLADLFRRDEQGRFVEIESYFRRHGIEHAESGQSSGEELLLALRRMVFFKVNKNIIRLYSEVDPVLGKVLRNLKLAVEKTKLFREEDRFGETFLAPASSDLLPSRAPIPLEVAERQFTRVVLLHDNVMMMVKKLHQIMLDQQEYQRVIPLVGAALMFKKVYTLGWEAQEELVSSAEQTMASREIAGLAQQVCKTLQQKMRQTYIQKEKMTEELFQKYLLAVQDIVVNEFDGLGDGDVSYFERLKLHLPNLTKELYREKHRKVLEYLAKTAKTAMRNELKTL